MSNSDHNYVVQNLKQINEVSSSFCLAKWLQSTIYMWNGFSHSCHHPIAHKVEVDAVKANPKALHNTPIKFVARADMLKGIQTKECDYCWNIENLGKDHLSDRAYKSVSNWALPYKEQVVQSGLGENINPRYLEVAFETTCNFKCTYCTPDVSSAWMAEVQTHGPMPLPSGKVSNNVQWLKQTGQFPLRHDEPNPYIDAFWKWWPELCSELHTFRITGGEPLLSKHTWKVMEYLIENPHPELNLAINTNLNVPRKLIEKLVNYSQKLATKVKSFSIFTSCEATGKQAEYIRFGMNYTEFCDNVDYFMSNTPDEVVVSFMITVNSLSYSTFTAFLDQLIVWRTKYNKDHRQNRMPIMVNYLRWPTHISMQELPEHLKPLFRANVEACIKRHQINHNDVTHQGLYHVESDQLDRLLGFMEDAIANPIEAADRYEFYRLSDERRGTKFGDVFPELDQPK